MPRIWSWLRAKARRRPTPARTPSPRPLARVSFDTLEDRLTPSTTSPHDAWRSERFHVDDAVVASITPPASATAATYANQSFGSLIGLDQVFTGSSYRGAGYGVAVLDTGIDYNHADLGGGWGQRVIAGYDFANGDSDPMDDNGHGTHVAGIIGSSNATYAGVAPNVNLLALKVLKADGSGSFGAVEDALRWVINNQATYNIVSINLSLGAGNFSANPYQFLDDEFATLKSQGVFISVAAGNSFYTYGSQPGLGYPGISSSVVSVGAVWAGNFGAVGWGSGARDNTTAADRIASFSQRSADLDLLAPGAMITSTYLHNQYKAMAGTSMAAPVVAGAAAILHQALDANHQESLANQDGILSLLQSTGVRIVDGDDEDDNVGNTNLAFQRLHIGAALAHIGGGKPANSAPTLAAIPNQTLSSGTSATITLHASDVDGDSVTLSARLVGLAGDSGQGYQLKQSLGLYHLGSYFTNGWGLNEKWLGGAAGNFYAILPNGELRRFTGTVSGLMSSSSLIASLSKSFYDDPSLLWNASPAPVGPLLLQLNGTQLTVSAGNSSTGAYQIEVTASDGKLTTKTTFSVTLLAPPANKAPVWGVLPDKSMSPTQDRLVVALNATDPEGQPLSYSAKILGASGVTATVSGSQLVLDPPAGFTGTFTVEVSASDGQTSASASFKVTVVNTAPVLTIPASVTTPRGAMRASIPISANDADGDRLTVTAQVVAPSSRPYQVKTSLGLRFAGSYFTNMLGHGEKWMVGSGGMFYGILPNGELRRWASSAAQFLSASQLIATLDRSVYDNPRLLWDAAAPISPKVAVYVVNNQVEVVLVGAGRGVVEVDVTLSDGAAATTKRVAVTFA